MTSRGVKRRGEATKTAIASSASTVRTAQTLVTAVTVLASSRRRARASRPSPARPPAVLVMRSVMSELPTARAYWATSSDRLAAAIVPVILHHGHVGARRPR